MKPTFLFGVDNNGKLVAKRVIKGPMGFPRVDDCDLNVASIAVHRDCERSNENNVPTRLDAFAVSREAVSAAFKNLGLDLEIIAGFSELAR